MAFHTAPIADSCRSDYTIISYVTVLLCFAIFRKMQFSTRAWNINNFRLSCISCDDSNVSLDIWTAIKPIPVKVGLPWNFKYTNGSDFVEWNTLNSRFDREIVKLLGTFNSIYLRSRMFKGKARLVENKDRSTDVCLADLQTRYKRKW